MFQYQAVVQLGTLGRYEEAKVEAERALTMVPQRSRLGGELRRALVELNLRLRNWTDVLLHANAGRADGFGDDNLTWASIWAHFSLRDLDSARRVYDSSRARPRSDDEAMVAIQLVRTGPPGESGLIAVLDLAEGYRGSEHVSASAYMALLEMGRNSEFSAEVSTRVTELADSFFESWPNSRILYRIDVSDLNNLVTHLKDTLAPASQLIEDFGKRVRDGELPHALLAAVAGRTVAEALLKRAVGCIVAGELTFRNANSTRARRLPRWAFASLLTVQRC